VCEYVSMCVCVYVCMCEARVCVSVCVRERVAGGGSSAALLAYARGDHGVSRAQTSTSLCFLAAYAAFLFICCKILFMTEHTSSFPICARRCACLLGQKERYRPRGRWIVDVIDG